MNVRKLGVVAATAGALIAPITFATPAQAGTVGCTLDSPFVAPAETINCYTDTAGYCVYFYDPVEVFPSGTVTETTNFAFCMAL
jgi:hypothetical protein